MTFTVKAGRSITGYETKKDEDTGDIPLTFTYSDGTKIEPVRIPKGDKGDPGRGIKDWKCEKTEIGGQKVTITFSDDTTQEFILDPGNGISSITSSINEDGERVIAHSPLFTDGLVADVPAFGLFGYRPVVFGPFLCSAFCFGHK